MTPYNVLKTVVIAGMCAPLVWATCKVAVSRTCFEDQPAVPPVCISKLYQNNVGSYCDSRDGECGREGCSMSNGVIATYYETVYAVENGRCTTPFLPTTGPHYGGICWNAVLWGPQCGPCPSGS